MKYIKDVILMKTPTKRISYLVYILSAIIGLSYFDSSFGQSVEPQKETNTLRHYAQGKKILIGSMAHSDIKSQEYRQILSREFNIVTSQFHLLPAFRPSRNEYNFKELDAMISFAQSNNMQVRGHALVCGSIYTGWMIGSEKTNARKVEKIEIDYSKIDRNEILEIIEDHVKTIVGRYKGRVAQWDVVNEAINDENGELKDNFLLKVIGPEYIELAFHWAHEADPGAKLFYNDNAAEEMNIKSDAVYALVKNLIHKGIPIDGVGMQMHINVNEPLDPEEVAINMQRLAEIGLEVAITELDVRIPQPATERDIAKQADIYQDMMEVCLTAPNCNTFVMWGFTDQHSWIPRAFGKKWGSALLFDENYNPKPAYYSVLEALKR